MKQPETADFSEEEFTRIEQIVDYGQFNYDEARRMVADRREEDGQPNHCGSDHRSLPTAVVFESTGKLGRSTLSEPRYGYAADGTPLWTTPAASTDPDSKPLAEVRNLIEDHRAIGRRLGQTAVVEAPASSLTGPEILEQARLSWGDSI